MVLRVWSESWKKPSARLGAELWRFPRKFTQQMVSFVHDFMRTCILGLRPTSPTTTTATDSRVIEIFSSLEDEHEVCEYIQ
jgi:hypothetical protein